MTDLPMTKAPDDLVERLREESLQLARRSFDSVDAGISANLCDRAIDEIERLRSQLAAAEAVAIASENDRHDLLKEIAAAEAQLQAMRKALEPFALRAEAFDPDEGDDEHIAFGLTIKIGWLRAAREALRSLTEGAGKC